MLVVTFLNSWLDNTIKQTVRRWFHTFLQHHLQLLPFITMTLLGVPEFNIGTSSTTATAANSGGGMDMSLGT